MLTPTDCEDKGEYLNCQIISLSLAVIISCWSEDKIHWVHINFEWEGGSKEGVTQTVKETVSF
jgi:hypothetical protein